MKRKNNDISRSNKAYTILKNVQVKVNIKTHKRTEAIRYLDTKKLDAWFMRRVGLICETYIYYIRYIQRQKNMT